MRAAAPLNAAPLQDAESADDGDRKNFLSCVAGEDGEKVAALFGDDHGHGGGGAAGGEPVAPTDDESGVVAESAAGKIILAAAAGNGGTEFGHGGCAGERVETAEEPDT